MLFSTISVLLVGLSPLALARPTEVRDMDPFLEYYAALEKREDSSSSSASSWPFNGDCDLSLAQMPSAPSPLPAPGPGQTLRSVMLGRGTQNYTCDTTKPKSEPVAIGAVATLFNASCIASTFPSLLEMMPGIALNFPVPSTSENAADNLLGGHHYFLDDSTPFFDLDTDDHQYGTVAMDGADKIDSDAPSDATVGSNGRGHGAVAWLRLESIPGNYQYKTVYRLNTAGGSPPATCKGMPKAFEVDYAAEYWFWE